MNQSPPKGNRPPPRPSRILGGIKYLLATLLIAALGSGFALEGSEEQTVLEGLQASSEEFSTFLGMLEETGLTDTLQQPGPITVLAPTDAAFDELDDNVAAELRSGPERLTSFVNGLIIPGRHELVDIEEAAETGALAPLSEEPYQVEVTAGGLTVNGVGFDPTDVDNVFSNGVVHVTNAVILPQELRGLANAEPPTEAAAEETDPATDPDAPTDPADPNAATDPTDPDAAAPAVTAPADQPDAEAAEPSEAFVRVVQLVPATSVDVTLTPTEEGLSSFEASDLEYAGDAGYQAVQPGSYLVNVTLPGSDDLLFDPPTESFGAGEYYTIAVTGLIVPDEEAVQEEQDGFAGWLNDLFGDNGDRDALSVRVTTYQDEVRTDGTESRVRVINAAPGSPAFDVVAEDSAGDRHVIAGNMTYGDDSGATALPADVTTLQVTAADSTAVAVDLAEELPLPLDATIFLTGTTFEGVPFDALVLPNGGGAGTTNAQ